MQRAIKFRAWDTKQAEWHKIDYTQFSGDGIPHVFELYDALGEVVFLQYTGLKDKNGVEIYEGDIVRFDFKTGTVTQICHWDAVFYGWRLGGFHYTLEELRSAQVIGNIYENPELIAK